MSNKFITLSEDGSSFLAIAIASSSGVADSHRIVATNAEGLLDKSLLPTPIERSSSRYVYTQPLRSIVWVIPHNLNSLYPALIIKDGSDNTLVGETIAIDSNNLKLTFTQPVSGTAYLNG